MQRAMQVPSALITAVNGLVVVFVVSSEFIKRKLSKKKYSEMSDEEQLAELKKELNINNENGKKL